MTKKQLGVAISRFRRENPEYSTWEGAHDQCFVASERFQNMLVDLKLIDFKNFESEFDVMQVSFWGKDHLPLPEEYKEHWVFRWRDIVVDWTARQFDPSAKWPEIRYTLWSPNE